MTDILVIPDTQIDPGVSINHLEALGNYTVEKQPEYIVHLGDHWNMQSLSIYDMGKIANEGARYQDDIEAGLDGILTFESAIRNYNDNRRYYRKKTYQPNKIFLLGNHENRIIRHVESYPFLAGKLSFDDLGLLDWDVVPFLEVIDIEGIKFSHYFINPDSVKNYPFSGTADYQLKSLGFSFVQGHKQGLHIASPRYLQDGKVIRGVIAGSFYQHNPEYLGPQGNNYWRGALMLEDVKDGMFRLTELPIDYLLQNYL